MQSVIPVTLLYCYLVFACTSIIDSTCNTFIFVYTRRLYVECDYMLNAHSHVLTETTVPFLGVRNGHVFV